MKKFTLMIKTVFTASLFSLASCLNHDAGTKPGYTESGSAKISITISKVGSLAKIAKTSVIELEKLYIKISAIGEETIYDTIPLNGNRQITQNLAYTGMASLKQWTLTAESRDAQDSIIHHGSTLFTIQPGQTESVSLSLAAGFSMLAANLFPIRDSVTRCELLLDGEQVDLESFIKQSRINDTVKLEFDYMASGTGGTSHHIRIDIYGDMWAFDELLYTNDTVINVWPGEDETLSLLLEWVGPDLPPPGQASMTVLLGAVGTVNIEGELEDASAFKIYWTDINSNKIQRSKKNGKGVEDLVVGPSSGDMALDMAGGKMYWTDHALGKVQRSNLDGSNVEDVITGIPHALGIDLDISGGKMYYISAASGNIQRADLNGSGIEILATGLGDARHITLDLINAKMYWSDAGTDKISRANLDGTSVEDVVTGLTGPYGIALELDNNKIYWSETSDGKIQRANLDGSDKEDLVTGNIGPGLALDLEEGKMYYFSGSPQELWRADLDGGNQESLVTGLSAPHGIQISKTN